MIDDWAVVVKEAFMTFSKEIHPSSSLLEVWILFFFFAFLLVLSPRVREPLNGLEKLMDE